LSIIDEVYSTQKNVSIIVTTIHHKTTRTAWASEAVALFKKEKDRSAYLSNSLRSFTSQQCFVNNQPGWFQNQPV